MFRLFVIATVINTLLLSCSSTVAVSINTMSLKAMDFEVFGRVQGVFFRKFTKGQADKLGIRGWCKNTDEGTVLGHMQGPIDKLESICIDLDALRDIRENLEKESENENESLSYYKYVPITSVDVERSFTTYKWILSTKRNRLKIENMEKLMIIYFNTSDENTSDDDKENSIPYGDETFSYSD